MKKDQILFRRDKNGHISRSQPRASAQKLVAAIESGLQSFQDAQHEYGIRQATLVQWMRLYGSDPFYVVNRRFSKEQKQQIIREADMPGVSNISVCRKYQISRNTIDKWRKQLCFVHSPNKDSDNSMEAASQQIRDLNNEIQDLRLKVLALETLIDIAERECNYPIRKKCGTKQ